MLGLLFLSRVTAGFSTAANDYSRSIRMHISLGKKKVTERNNASGSKAKISTLVVILKEHVKLYFVRREKRTILRSYACFQLNKEAGGPTRPLPFKVVAAEVGNRLFKPLPLPSPIPVSPDLRAVRANGHARKRGPYLFIEVARNSTHAKRM